MLMPYKVGLKKSKINLNKLANKNKKKSVVKKKKKTPRGLQKKISKRRKTYG